MEHADMTPHQETPIALKHRERKAGAIGDNLKALRKEKGLTIAAVASASGISAASVSRIENGRISPTFEAIVNLARGLKVDVSELFYHTEDAAFRGWLALTRAQEGEVIETPNYRYRPLCNNVASKEYMVLETTVLNRSLEEFGGLQKHSGQEQIIVTSGEVTVWTELYDPIQLKVGDSLAFDSTLGHAITYNGDTPATMTWVCSAYA
ncbi:MAG: XRE family transcriptional regulator [Cobetia sp.]|jgi:transcriptional regulator with XRE-family HTH domain|nr:XRE family transcriptional regulator [Cobetia sp.]MBK08661.1 XRE family transcriptional regulator [Cobetia sp.]HBJ26879.1 XRE family transcriptional regulator [Cobetia sp.]|tara:strand:- start:39312 stop:39935 length:624 start_codon:yes stop_codon:yes gene_type:complete